MRTTTKPRRSAAPQTDLAVVATPLHVAAPPGLLDREHTAIHADDDTDEDYKGKQRFLDAMLAYAKKHD
jgi:hypothetical protein